MKIVLKETPKHKIKPNNTIIKIYPEAEQIEIIPEKNEQIKKGMFNQVTVKGDENLVAENIKQGTKIFGVEGSYTGVDIAITSGRYLFFSNARLDYMNEILALCRGLTDMRNMFESCSALDEIDLTGLDISQVTSFYYTFRYCTKAKKIKFNGADTGNVTDMTYMFYNCTALTEMQEMDTSNVTNMNSMFESCKNLKEIKQMDTSKVTNMNGIFYSCIEVTKIPQLEAGNVNRVKNAFNNCRKLVDFGGLKDIGKAFTQKTDNYSEYTQDYHYCTELSYESLMNIFYGLYDLNLVYDVANGGTLYRQKLYIGSVNKAKLEATEEGRQALSDADKKGWNVT